MRDSDAEEQRRGEKVKQISGRERWEENDGEENEKEQKE